MDKRTVEFKTQSPVLYREIDEEKDINAPVELMIEGNFIYMVSDDEVFNSSVGIDIDNSEELEQFESKLSIEVEKTIQIVMLSASSAGIHFDELATEYVKVLKTFKDELYERWLREKGISLLGVIITTIRANREQAEEIDRLRKSEKAIDNMQSDKYLKSLQANVLRATATQWICECGRENRGNECELCGKPKPIISDWRCVCGKVNKGEICMNCGRRYRIHVM